MRFSADAGWSATASVAATSAASIGTRLKILAYIKNPQSNGGNLPAARAGEKRCDILCRGILCASRSGRYFGVLPDGGG